MRKVNPSAESKGDYDYEQTIDRKKGLTVKDLVTVGIFSAMFLVFALVGGIFFAPNPVLTFYMPVGSALLCGPVYLLMLAKAPKRFAVSILGAILCIVWFVTGMHWAMALGYLVLGIIADLVAGAGQYKSRKINSLSYILLSLGGTGSYLMFFVNPDGWAKTMLGNGTEQSYIDTMHRVLQFLFILPHTLFPPFSIPRATENRSSSSNRRWSRLP